MSSSFESKGIARLAAVQAIFQTNLAGLDPAAAVCNFTDFYVTKEKEYEGISLKFYKRLISKFSENVHYDEIIAGCINDKKNLFNRDSLIDCIIKVAIIEMMFEKTDIPVIINEYLEIAKKFVDPRSLKFVNVLLDRISKVVVRKCHQNL
jgi:N utilization substance protein B